MKYTILELDSQVCHSLYSASNALIRAYRPLLQPLGLTYPQYVVMMSLWQREGVSVKELSGHTRLDSGTLTPLLKRLEAKGYLTRSLSVEDERRKVISLTSAGLQLKQSAKEVPESLACQSTMPTENLHQLKSLCDQLLKEIDKVAGR
ncbi:MAG: MarR family transcriptional regulator [Kangiellaceae bacterium]|nr:MarR family transcriptional regulator [Kangiellaceae bacterium]